MAVSRDWKGSGLLVPLLLLAVYAAAHSALADDSNRRAVNVDLVANWDATPLQLEAAEFFAENLKPLGFWEVVDSLSTLGDSSVKPTEEALYDKVVQHAAQVLPELRQHMLHYALLSRYYSPKVEMFRQYSRGHVAHCENNDAWVHAGSTVLCTPEELQRYLEQPSNATANAEEASLVFGELEHLYPNDAPTSAPLAVLYGQIGMPSFSTFHSLLRDAANASNVHYAVRHYTPEEPIKRLMNLQGYGVELAIKSTEYKVIDDKVSESDAEQDEEQAQPQEQDMTIEGFQFDKLKQRKPELSAELDAFREHLQMLSQQNEGFQTLRVWQVKTLGYQAAQRIMSAAEPLQLLRDISHNFPPIANSLSRLRLDVDVSSEIEDNQEILERAHLTGDFINLNGHNIPAKSLNPFGLYELLTDEMDKIDALSAFGLARTDTEKLLALVPNQLVARFDLRDRAAPKRSYNDDDDDDDDASDQMDPNNVNGAIQFANDLEQDDMYRHWPAQLKTLLQPVYPGQLRYIRRNVQTLIAVVDPSTLQGITLMANLLSMVEQGLPFRIGFVFSVEGGGSWEHSAEDLEAIAMGEFKHESEEAIVDKAPISENLGTVLVRSYFFLKHKLGGDTGAALSLYSVIYQLEGEVTTELVWEACRIVLEENNLVANKKIWQSALRGPAVEAEYRAMRQYIERKGLALSDPDSQYLFTNGKLQILPPGAPVSSMLQNLFMQETYYGYLPFQEALFRRKLTNDVDDLWSWILEQSSPLYSTFSRHVFRAEEAEEAETEAAEDRQRISLAKHKELLAPHTAYLSNPSSEFETKQYSHVFLVDLTSRLGLTQALEAVLRLAATNSESVRVGFLHNTNQDPLLVQEESRDKEFFVPRAIHAALNSGKFSTKRVFPFVARLLALALLSDGDTDLAARINELAVDVGLKDVPGLMAKLAPQAYALFARDRALALSAFGVQPGSGAVVTNGRVTRLEDQVMRVQDMQALESYEGLVRVDQIKAVLDGVTEHQGVDPDDLTSEFYSNEMATIVSVLSQSQASSSSGRKEFPSLKPSFVAGELEKPVLTLTAVLNPLSKGTQQIVPLLISLVNHNMGVQVRVVLNPKRELTELPLKTFYRHVMQDKLAFDSDGRLLRDGAAVFNNLPTSLLLTMHLDTPQSWVTQAIRSVYDLDNILLKDMGKDRVLSATFELQHVLIEAQCLDVDRGMPAVGLQINLGTDQQPHMTDTTVMRNLGYLQLKANPGLWWLSLGKRFGDDEADPSNQGPYQLQDGRTPVTRISTKIHRFTGDFGAVTYQVRRGKAVQQAEQVVQEEEAVPRAAVNSRDEGIWGQVMGYFGSSGEATTTVKDQTIHVFSVASSHLYERFLKIMMLTVLKNTKSPVKFWFLENYLSPKFKEYAPVFSRAYNTSIELVTYQWPSWMHHETEKQRVIWGYKILFLDVLFPMDLGKVIFVDADQIVRADLRELYDMDLEGKPLAYTPFCSTRKEMDGFRFWNSGFWKNHLGEKPYHISALYVIDLKRFRTMGAGDTIRATYQQLSQDASSLANLDQDLPNYLQVPGGVPIFSLPQEWLWCETWCDDESKARAKTIDLCNNPLTKTPKLDNALRIIPDWRDLDEEARRIELGAQDISTPSTPSTLSDDHVPPREADLIYY